jgi:pantoate kinase
MAAYNQQAAQGEAQKWSGIGDVGSAVTGGVTAGIDAGLIGKGK